MQPGLSRAVVIMATMAIGMLAADNSVGTWNRNTEKSKYNPIPPNAVRN